jgi:hypothetical protein
MMSERHDATLSPEQRSKLGAHYTPAEWARVVAARGLQPLMCWPEAMQCPACAPSVALTNLLVIDLACGDGVFLSAAADILGELLWEAYQCEGIECDKAEARARIEENVLLGVDLDPGAIAAAREALPDTELVCADALFDFDFDTDGRPTAFLMNPPYLGGGKISGTLGTAYQKRLLKEFPHSNGGADLCVYFLLQAAHILDQGGSKGTISAICTNTISQGRTREAGLRFLVQDHRDTIYCADRDVRWPGEAKVVCSVVHLANEELWQAISSSPSGCEDKSSAARIIRLQPFAAGKTQGTEPSALPLESGPGSAVYTMRSGEQLRLLG